MKIKKTLDLYFFLGLSPSPSHSSPDPEDELLDDDDDDFFGDADGDFAWEHGFNTK